jgi:CRP-like cAMP-binding protein
VLSGLEKALALRSAPLFASLSADALMPVATVCDEVTLAPEETLFEAGEVGDALYVVLSGAVAVVRDGEEVARLGAGQCVGEMAALDWEPRSATVVAVEASHLVRLERADLLDLLTDHPELVRSLALVLAERIRSAV